MEQALSEVCKDIRLVQVFDTLLGLQGYQVSSGLRYTHRSARILGQFRSSIHSQVCKDIRLVQVFDTLIGLQGYQVSLGLGYTHRSARISGQFRSWIHSQVFKDIRLVWIYSEVCKDIRFVQVLGTLRGLLEYQFRSWVQGYFGYLGQCKEILNRRRGRQGFRTLC